MEIPEYNEEEVVRKYVIEEMSVPQIAKIYGTYPNKVLRTLKRKNTKIRTNSESQKLAIKKGRKLPPNTGEPLSEEQKIAISEGMSAFWNAASDSFRKKHRERAVEQWDKLSEEDKAEMQKLARTAILNAARNGSKIEVAIRDALENEAIPFLCNHKGFLIDKDLEVDVFVPSHNVGIEVDGVYHSSAIHGQDKLQKRIQADRKKNGLLIGEGYWIIRVRAFTKKNPSKKDYRNICAKVIDTLNSLPDKPQLINIDIE